MYFLDMCFFPLFYLETYLAALFFSEDGWLQNTGNSKFTNFLRSKVGMVLKSKDNTYPMSAVV